MSVHEDQAYVERMRRYEEMRERLAWMTAQQQKYERERLLKRLGELEDELEMRLSTYSCDECYAPPRLDEDGVRLVYDRCEPSCSRWLAVSSPSPEHVAAHAEFARRHRRDPRADGYLPLSEVLPGLSRMRCPDCGVEPSAFVHPETEHATAYYECASSCPNR